MFSFFHFTSKTNWSFKAFCLTANDVISDPFFYNTIRALNATRLVSDKGRMSVLSHSCNGSSYQTQFLGLIG